MATYTGPRAGGYCGFVATMVALVVFFRFWKPKRVMNAKGEDITGRRGRGEQALGQLSRRGCRGSRLSVVVFVWGIPRISRWMDAKTS
jgi:lactate permease